MTNPPQNSICEVLLVSANSFSQRLHKTFILFYFILFYFILFYFILFYFISFHFISFHFFFFMNGFCFTNPHGYCMEGQFLFSLKENLQLNFFPHGILPAGYRRALF